MNLAAAVALALASSLESAATRDVVLLTEARPLVLRLQFADPRGGPFLETTPTPALALFHVLDRNGDGTLRGPEASPAALAAITRLLVIASDTATATATTTTTATTTAGPLTPEGLAEALPEALGRFRLSAERPNAGRADALFDHIDRDKDGRLSRPDIAGVVRSLHRLDLNDDEAVSPEELEPFRAPEADMAAAVAARPGRLPPPTARPAAVARSPGESALRLAMVVVRAYDRGRPGGGRPDGALSPDEFAIGPTAFERADTDRNGVLSGSETRRHLEKAPPDVTLVVTFPDEPGAEGAVASNPPALRVEAGNPPAEGVTARSFSGDDVEIVAGSVRVEIRHDAERGATAPALRASAVAFRASDVNSDGYLETSELARPAANAALPIAGLFEAADRDGDGKLYPAEFEAIVSKLAASSRGRVAVEVSDEGRALFGVLDADRDRRLGAREVQRAAERVASWDADGDREVGADEIPSHVLITVARGGLPGLTAAGPRAGAGMVRRPGDAVKGRDPSWFWRMDLNRDGDVSRREFLGPREVFDRLDRDGDGLLDAAEAAREGPSRAP